MAERLVLSEEWSSFRRLGGVSNAASVNVRCIWEGATGPAEIYMNAIDTNILFYSLDADKVVKQRQAESLSCPPVAMFIVTETSTPCLVDPVSCGVP